VSKLIDVLTLDDDGAGRFVGRTHDLGRARAYGGLVVAQALGAGMLTVPDRLPHSLHAYFLSPGDANAEVSYEVEPVREGRSITMRRVQALQNGRAILAMMISFHEAEPGLDHQDRMPDVPSPDDCPSDAEMARRYFDRLAPDDPRRRAAKQAQLFEMRHVYPGGFFGGGEPRPHNAFWFRAVKPLPDVALLQYCALAYASDFGPMATALLPHGKAPVDDDIRLTSIDHALWFHRPIRMDDWLLYDLVTPSGQGGRGLSFGRIFTRDGRLVASAAQEGIMRQV
jgi:acyl-CoA thioesterase-2